MVIRKKDMVRSMHFFDDGCSCQDIFEICMVVSVVLVDIEAVPDDTGAVLVDTGATVDTGAVNVATGLVIAVNAATDVVDDKAAGIFDSVPVVNGCSSGASWISSSSSW